MTTVSTQACWLTAAGRSAVAVIALRGPNAAAALQPLFTPRTPHGLETAEPGTIRFGQWSNGEEVVVCRTSGDWEIHCHGGVAAAPQILNDLQTQGVTVIDRTQWQVAPHNSEVVNAAWQRLARATTTRTAAILLDQARGAWDRHAQQIERWLNDHHEASRERSREQAAAAVARLRQWTDLGRRLDRPWQVALLVRRTRARAP